MDQSTNIISLESHLPEHMLAFLAMADDQCAATDDRSEKLLLINQAIERAAHCAARFQAWAMDPRDVPCPEKFPVHADDFTNVIQALENRREAIEKQIRAEIAAAENAPIESFRPIGSICAEIAGSAILARAERRRKTGSISNRGWRS